MPRVKQQVRRAALLAAAVGLLVCTGLADIPGLRLPVHANDIVRAGGAGTPGSWGWRASSGCSSSAQPDGPREQAERSPSSTDVTRRRIEQDRRERQAACQRQHIADDADITIMLA
jgi:hypothetical protein